MRFVTAHQGARQRESRRIASVCSPFQRRAAGKAQAQHLGGLVEGFAHRIVDGGGEPAITADAFYAEQLAMPAGDQQQQIGELQVRICQAG